MFHFVERGLGMLIQLQSLEAAVCNAAELYCVVQKGVSNI